MSKTIVAIVGLLLVLVPNCSAQNYAIVYNFAVQPDGQNPNAAVVRGTDGSLYGTTTGGGTYGEGSIFKIGPDGKETVLHSFSGKNGDGAYPNAPLVMDAAGNLYGTTLAGGNTDCFQNGGCGIVFKLSKNGNGKVLYTFSGSVDGARPEAPLLLAPDGKLYGTTTSGGNYGLGTVFQFSGIGGETVLHSFTGGYDDATPYGGLIHDKNGNLYGTTSGNMNPDTTCEASAGNGTVFRLSPIGHLTVLHAFQGGRDGRVPCSGLTAGTSGELYGTTALGGTDCIGFGECGTIFEIDKTGRMTVLHIFEGTEGINPYSTLVRDASGTLYGTAVLGGDINGYSEGHGTVFSLDITGQVNVLHAFTGAPDGAYIFGGLTLDSSGTLYGTATFQGANGYGIVFSLIPQPLPYSRAICPLLRKSRDLDMSLLPAAFRYPAVLPPKVESSRNPSACRLRLCSVMECRKPRLPRFECGGKSSTAGHRDCAEALAMPLNSYSMLPWGSPLRPIQPQHHSAVQREQSLSAQGRDVEMTNPPSSFLTLISSHADELRLGV